MPTLTIFSVLFYVIMAFVVWQIRPGSRIYQKTCNQQEVFTKKWNYLICIATILPCTLIMNISPDVTHPEATSSNSEDSNIHYRLDHYEQLAESFLQGHLYYNYEPDPRLVDMVNPYDTQARNSQNIHYNWDHAFYNGHYYMYFGVVPVITLFLPYRILTGSALLGYHGSQIFIALFIIAIFLLFRLLAKRFFCQLPIFLYYVCCITVSVISVWYTAARPMVYALAQASAFCFAAWGIFFWAKACFDKDLTDHKAITYMTLGTLFGALTFGCRPTIAMFNILIIPFVIILSRTFVREKKYYKLIWIAVPYIVVGIGLMVYNYLRFDNPFEFGQSYQLTEVDQTSYAHPTSRISFSSFYSSLKYYYIHYPYTSFNLQKFGILLTYPIISFSLVLLFFKRVRSSLRQNDLWAIVLTSLSSTLIIILFMAVFSPWPLPRYKMDFVWLLGIISFLITGISAQSFKGNKWLLSMLAFCSFVSVFCSCLQFLTPYDKSISEYYPEIWYVTKQILVPFVHFQI